MPRQLVMRISSGSSRPYEQAPAVGMHRQASCPLLATAVGDGVGYQCRWWDLPAPMPFSPFSSSARSLKLRGT